MLTASTFGSASVRLRGLGLCCFEKGLGIAAVAYHPKLGYLQPYLLCVLDPKPKIPIIENPKPETLARP